MRVLIILFFMCLFAGNSHAVENTPMWKFGSDWICVSNKMHECVLDSRCAAQETDAIWSLNFEEDVMEYLTIEYREEILHKQEKNILYYSNDIFLSSGRVLSLRPVSQERYSGRWTGYSTEGTSSTVSLREWRCAPSR